MRAGLGRGEGGGLGTSCEDQQLGRGRLKCSAVLLGMRNWASNLIRLMLPRGTHFGIDMGGDQRPLKINTEISDARPLLQRLALDSTPRANRC